MYDLYSYLQRGRRSYEMFKMWACTRISKNIDQTKDTRNWINHICDGSGSSIDNYNVFLKFSFFYNQSSRSIPALRILNYKISFFIIQEIIESN